MSSVVPFNGLGAPSGGSNPLMNRLRRIGSFKEGQNSRSDAIAAHKEIAEHAHGLQSKTISQAGREVRKNQSHSAAVHAEMVASLTTQGVDFGAPGSTKVSYGDLSVETNRPKPPKAAKTAPVASPVAPSPAPVKATPAKKAATAPQAAPAAPKATPTPTAASASGAGPKPYAYGSNTASPDQVAASAALTIPQAKKRPPTTV